MAEEQETKERKPPFYEVLCEMLIGNVQKYPEMRAWELSAAAAITLKNTYLPPDLRPQVKEAVKNAWSVWGPNGNDDLDVQVAIAELAKELGVELPDNQKNDENG